METAFFLGLTSGGSCLASCGPLAAALLASEEIPLRRSSALLSVFLSGRLLGYLCWAVLSWLLGWLISQSTKGFALFSAADLALGAWLIYYGIRPPVPSHGSCPGSTLNSLNQSGSRHGAFFRGGLWGFLSGLQVCAPFLTAFAEAARTGSLGGSLLFFLLFYLGTGIWFIPFPFIGTLGRFRQIAQVARFLTLPLGAYFIYSGIISIAGGMTFYG
ncbi:MAG TPA: sulfite exporter TauE/SafE family protein [Thermodesulfobacteriota bacterium]|nr:sulfite exporter TauE/SafE family protein [Thermodesulfobacteriota bacterium]